MALWQEKGSNLETESELDEYMYYVAGLVGLMITEVFSVVSSLVHSKRERLMELAAQFGLGLQTVNIIRGSQQGSAA